MARRLPARTVGKVKAPRVPADATRVMPLAVLNAATRLLVASWRGQLAVLGCSTVLLAVLLLQATTAGDLWLRSGVGAVALCALAAASMRVALVHERAGTSSVQEETVAVLALLPRIVVQCGVLVVPFLLVQAVMLRVADHVAIFGIVLVALLLAIGVVLVVPVALALAAIVHGDRSWLPERALAALRVAPLGLTCSVLVGGTAAALASLLLIVPALVIAAIAGPASALGGGLAAASIVPWIGCGALALWRAAGVEVEPLDLGESSPASAGPASRIDHHACAELAAWNVAVEPGAVWGTWVQLPMALEVGVLLDWSPGAVPELLLAGPDGAWVRPPQPTTTGDVVAISMPAGATWLQVGVRGPGAQSVAIRLLDRSRVAA